MQVLEECKFGSAGFGRLKYLTVVLGSNLKRYSVREQSWQDTGGWPYERKGYPDDGNSERDGFN